METQPRYVRGGGRLPRKAAGPPPGSTLSLLSHPSPAPPLAPAPQLLTCSLQVPKGVLHRGVSLGAQVTS